MRIGIDLGGTKIECIALDASGEVLLRRRLPTPRDDYEGTLQAIAQMVEECERAGEGREELPAAVGVGHPGAISPASGLIKNANSAWLNGRPLANDLQQLLGRPLRLANDANCFALSEAADGAGSGARVVFGVIIGTGTGGGIVVEGHVLTGPNSICGEWGHNPIPWPLEGERPGPPCYCGRTGCIETFLSGPGLARDFRASPDAPPEELEARAIVSLASAGEPRASAALRRYTERMARALAGVINLLDPDVIVLGGGMSQIMSLYEEVPRLWSPWVFSDRVDTQLVPARHGDASGVRGAAWLWP